MFRIAPFMTRNRKTQKVKRTKTGDKSRKQFVMRQFHVEGFVNQYVNTSTSADGKTIVFTSESIENIPAGFRARETYKILGPDEFTEVFEIAEPGKDFEVYSEGHFKRKK